MILQYFLHNFLTGIAVLIFPVPAVVVSITDPRVQYAGGRVVTLHEAVDVRPVSRREVRTVLWTITFHLI